jgi:hypothetical protein
MRGEGALAPSARRSRRETWITIVGKSQRLHRFTKKHKAPCSLGRLCVCSQSTRAKRAGDNACVLRASPAEYTFIIP